VYYGDEFGKQNDEEYYHEQIKLTGKDDTRFLVRGRIDWAELEKQLAIPDSFNSQVYGKLSRMLKTRSQHKAFGRGTIDWKTNDNKSLLMYSRIYNDDRILVIQNLSDNNIEFELEQSVISDLLSNNCVWDNESNKITLKSHGYIWLNF